LEFEVTLTLYYPTTGTRFGPGMPFAAHWDFIGPHVSGTTLQVSLRDPSSGVKFIFSEYLFPTNDLASIFGNQTLGSGAVQEGRSDNFTCTLTLEVNVPGSGTVDALDTTGFHWDPVSGLAYISSTNALYVVANVASGSSPTLAAILAAVKQSYHN